MTNDVLLQSERKRPTSTLHTELFFCYSVQFILIVIPEVMQMKKPTVPSAAAASLALWICSAFACIYCSPQQPAQI